MAKFLDLSGATTFANKVKTLLNNKVDKVSGKGLSTNDFTTAYKNKLDDTVSKTVTGQDGAHAMIGLSWNGVKPIFGVDLNTNQGQTRTLVTEQDLANVFKVVRNKKSNAITIAKSGDQACTITGCSLDGYTPVGVVGHRVQNASSGGANSSLCRVYRVQLSGTTVTMNLRNTSTTASAKIELLVDILFIKDGFVSISDLNN